MNSRTVYIVHLATIRQVELDEKGREVETWVPRHDLSRAAVYGKLEILLKGSHQIPFDPQEMIPMFRKKLRNLHEDDYILPTGDPLAMGIAIAVAAEMNEGVVNVLRWERRARKYLPVTIDFHSTEYAVG